MYAGMQRLRQICSVLVHAGTGHHALRGLQELLEECPVNALVPSPHPPASVLRCLERGGPHRFFQVFGMPYRLELEMNDVILVLLQTSDQGPRLLQCNLQQCLQSWLGLALVWVCTCCGYRKRAAEKNRFNT